MQDIWQIKTLFDSHCHLSYLSDDINFIVANTKSAGVEQIVDIAVDYQSSLKTAENAKLFPGVVLASCGIDPEVLVPGSELYWGESASESKIAPELQKIEELLKTGTYSVLGECGLDFYWLDRNTTISNQAKETSKQLQKLLFIYQIGLAKTYKLPISVHSRGAEAEAIDLLMADAGPQKAILHSFTGTIDQAKSAIANGFKIGINGIVTYKSAENIRAMLKQLCLKKIETPKDLYDQGFYLETDAPYLLPRLKEAENLSQNSPVAISFLWKYILARQGKT
jgi:TatD DNase family protein